MSSEPNIGTSNQQLEPNRQQYVTRRPVEEAVLRIAISRATLEALAIPVQSEGAPAAST